ncbi:MAG: energy transducer TonB [Terracidiphilus sp.]|nr:energy transducer TonB [Terracidiphilus sp.]MDR3775903.1 energy transducer TonB [Terracidiphilus sp.]
MKKIRLGIGQCRLRNTAAKLFQVAALALLVSLALPVPARAADDRAVKSRVAPVYPELAKRMKIGGLIKVEATVDPGGSVLDTKTVSGNHMLSVAAEEAVRKWKFVPAAAQSTVEVSINFALSQ